MDEIAEGKGKKRVWHSNRDAKAPAKQKAPLSKPPAKPRARAKAAAGTGAQKKSSRATHDRLPGFVPPSLATLHSDAPRGTDGCTRSNTTAIASRPGSIAARCAC